MTESNTAGQTHPKQLRRVACQEPIAAVILWLTAVLVISAFCWIFLEIVPGGGAHLSASFLLDEPEDAGRSGGIGPIIMSTLLILAVTLGTAGPLSLATAIALSEASASKSGLLRIARRCLDVQAAVPSIVFGLFGNAFFSVALGMGYSILAGGLTLGCMVLPILVRTSEQAIRAVPDDYRCAAAGLGLSRSSTLFRIILPAAAPAMAAGLVLGVGRALAETAALIFTAGYVTRWPESLTDSGRTLSVHIYDLAMNVPGGSSSACATASVLILLLLALNVSVMLLARRAVRQSDLLSGANH